MQTVDLHYDVPMGYTLEEFVAKVNSYVAHLAKKSIVDDNFVPNKDTKEAICEAQSHIDAYKKGEEWARNDIFDNVNDLMADLMKQ